jgi:DNA-binding CsgD family transcriptional regulator
MKIQPAGFTTFREQDGLASDRVFSVLADRTGAVLAVTISSATTRRFVNVFDGVKFRAQVPKVFGDHPTWGQHQILLQSRIGEWWAASAVGLCRFPPVKAADLARTQPKACLFAEGHQNKTAAAELGISIHTVGFHLRSIYEKLHVHTRSEAVARALRDGLIH